MCSMLPSHVCVRRVCVLFVTHKHRTPHLYGVCIHRVCVLCAMYCICTAPPRMICAVLRDYAECSMFMYRALPHMTCFPLIYHFPLISHMSFHIPCFLSYSIPTRVVFSLLMRYVFLLHMMGPLCAGLRFAGKMLVVLRACLTMFSLFE